VVEATIKRFGKLDVLFVNAGSGTITPIASTTLETFESVLRTNVTSPFLLVQAAAPYLKKGSSIIFNGSISSMVGRPSTAAYAASKGALRSMARVIASELSPAGIRVNVISPGSIRTPMLSHVAASGPQQEALVNSMGESIPLERIGDAEEVAKAVLFLASSDSSFIHAAEIIVDGGMTGAPMGAPVYRTTARETSAKPDPHSTPAAG
jgi:NAD(P)-dependent dehydrogenase (short-subunit alcohol dehydrogenase family)